ncbi:hypothetical protein [Streptomyces sp. NPDC008317]|uniref:hypothetical protein n=1 Tax=Streptomyces sp. NPDC008317 TaxID=3364827 RepID=UPI0036E11471
MLKATDAGSNVRSMTNEFIANNSESLTKTTSPTGAAQSTLYGNTAPASKYLLQWSKDDLSGKTTTYAYDPGNRLTSVATSGGWDHVQLRLRHTRQPHHRHRDNGRPNGNGQPVIEQVNSTPAPPTSTTTPPPSWPVRSLLARGQEL